MIGLSVTHQAMATTEVIAEFHGLGTGLGNVGIAQRYRRGLATAVNVAQSRRGGARLGIRRRAVERDG